MLTFLFLWPMPEAALRSSLNSASLSSISKSQSFVNNPVLLDVDPSRSRIFFTRRLQIFNTPQSEERLLLTPTQSRPQFLVPHQTRRIQLLCFLPHWHWHCSSPSLWILRHLPNRLGCDLIWGFILENTIHLPKTSSSRSILRWGFLRRACVTRRDADRQSIFPGHWHVQCFIYYYLPHWQKIFDMEEKWSL